MQREFQTTQGEINQEKVAQAKVGIVVSRFNEDVTGAMLEGAREKLIASGVKKENIEVFYVPGAFELPLACQKLAQKEKYQGLMAIGCVIKGQSDHYYYIAAEATRGLMQVMLQFSLPVAFGVLTVTSLEQALERSQGQANKGYEAANALLQMMSEF